MTGGRFLKDSDPRYEDPLHERHYRDHTPNTADSNCPWCVEEFMGEEDEEVDGDEWYEEDDPDFEFFDPDPEPEPEPEHELTPYLESPESTFTHVQPNGVAGAIYAMAVAISKGVEGYQTPEWAGWIAKGYLELDKKMREGEELPSNWQIMRVDFPLSQLNGWADRPLTENDVREIVTNMSESAIPGEIWDLAQPRHLDATWEKSEEQE